MENIATNTITLGQQAEKLACHYLQGKGLILKQTNYGCKLGEIDLIMKDKKQLVFVEVRYRKNDFFGSGAETVDNRKQRKLILTANHYLSAKNKHNMACRFDVISICGKMCIDNINWISDAFSS
ncbi:MAG: YraN family protein [Gammaproteobacteria bacterium]|nr:YraN family protein [Gammaproteobacteria bacterium]